MSKLLARALLLTLAACPAWGQFELFLVNGSIVQPVSQTYSLGNIAPGTSASTTFRITNISTTPAILNLLTLNGTGFSVASSNAPTLPASLNPQQPVDFTVVFQATSTGTFNATLTSVGIVLTLTAIVPVELAYEWVAGTGVQSLAAGPVNFGSVPVSQSPTLELLALNQTGVSLTIPAVTVTGSGFSLYGPSPAGVTVAPSASKAFNVQFVPAAAGVANGILTIGAQTYTLTGTGTQPPLPQPTIAITLPQAGSAQQGTVAIELSAASPVFAIGTMTLSFLPNAAIPGATDPAISFVTGSRSVNFNVFIGATQASFDNQPALAFAAGTTAGTLTVTVQLGDSTVQQSVTILPAVVGVTAAQGVRSANSVEVDVTGFDNTRSAGALSFTFYDASGNPVAAPVAANGASAFGAYFQDSAGGTFVLKAVFPVAGNTSQIAAFRASVTNSVGTSTSPITSF
jgi:hypothetical protein